MSNDHDYMTYILILTLEWAVVGLAVFGLICLVRRMWEWLKRKWAQK